MKKALAGLAVLMVSSSVFAAGDDNGIYISASVGQPRIDAYSEEDAGFKLTVGYAYSRKFSLEGGWARSSASVSSVSESTERTVDSIYIAGVGNLPVSDAISLHVKSGLASNIEQTDVTSGGSTASSDDTTVDVMFGVGAAYAVTPKLSVIAEYERFSSVKLLSAGVRYSF